MNDYFQNAVEELERIVGRITRNDPILTVEDEGGKHWIVVDLANNQDAVMLRTPSTAVVARFVEAFLRRHPKARFQPSGEEPEVPNRRGAVADPTVAQAEPHVEPESFPGFSVRVPALEGGGGGVVRGTTAPPPPSNVVPIRQRVAS